MIECTQCGRQHYAIGGRSICSTCAGVKGRIAKYNCDECNKQCLNTGGDGLCGSCKFLKRYQEERLPDARRCDICNRVLRTKKEFITRCTRKSCGGLANYYKVCRSTTK